MTARSKISQICAITFGLGKDPRKVVALKVLSGGQPLNAFSDILDDLLNAVNKSASH